MGSSNLKSRRIGRIKLWEVEERRIICSSSRSRCRGMVKVFSIIICRMLFSRVISFSSSNSNRCWCKINSYYSNKAYNNSACNFKTLNYRISILAKCSNKLLANIYNVTSSQPKRARMMHLEDNQQPHKLKHNLQVQVAETKLKAEVHKQAKRAELYKIDPSLNTSFHLRKSL